MRADTLINGSKDENFKYIIYSKAQHYCPTDAPLASFMDFRLFMQ